MNVSTLEAELSLNACRVFNTRLLEVMQREGLSPLDFIEGGSALWQHYALSEKNIKKLSELLVRGWATREAEACKRLGVRLLSFFDAAYPSALKDLEDPPLLLYIWGELSPGGRAVSVVGTRRCSPYGKRTAAGIGERCARGGWGLISGGARGIDAAAHQGALDNRGTTFAVLGTGVDQVFPSEHGALFERIRANGALLSEYPLGTQGRAWNFPQRNRIIAALCSRLVVVEAPHKSGAMITAKQALNLGRDIWAVPGRIDEDIAAGSNQLIFDGAYALVNYDVLGIGESTQRTLFAETDSLADPTDRLLVRLLREQGDRTVDNLAAAVKMSAADVARRLSVLAALGHVFQSSPGRYGA